MRPLLALLALLLALAATAAVAGAEEIFELDSGAVVRGKVVREDADRIVVRLTGLMEANTITLHAHEITRRYVGTEPNPRPRDHANDAEAPVPDVPLTGHVGVPRTVRFGRDGAQADPDAGGLPTTEPDLMRESFFERLARVTRMAFPHALEGRLLVGCLLLIVLAVIVAGGTRLLGMKAATLHASTTLGLMLGVCAFADILWHEEMLRADRALWLVPLQVVIWLATARALLEAPLSRTIPLLAVVVFASTAFLFATGSLLVSV